MTAHNHRPGISSSANVTAVRYDDPSNCAKPRGAAAARRSAAGNHGVRSRLRRDSGSLAGSPQTPDRTGGTQRQATGPASPRRPRVARIGSETISTRGSRALGTAKARGTDWHSTNNPPAHPRSASGRAGLVAQSPRGHQPINAGLNRHSTDDSIAAVFRPHAVDPAGNSSEHAWPERRSDHGGCGFGQASLCVGRERQGRTRHRSRVALLASRINRANNHCRAVTVRRDCENSRRASQNLAWHRDCPNAACFEASYSSAQSVPRAPRPKARAHPLHQSARDGKVPDSAAVSAGELIFGKGAF